MIIEQRQVGRMAVFAYLIGDEESGQAIVVDPADEVHDLIALAGRYGLRITTVVNTHGHPDHIGGNAAMKEKTGAQIVIHEADADLLVSTPPAILKVFGASPSPPADRKVRDGDSITAGGITLEVLHTPGHSPGSMVLYTDGYAFTGDTLFVGSVGRTDLPGGSGALLMDSLCRKLAALPDETVVMPGHNYGAEATSTIGREKRLNPFLR